MDIIFISYRRNDSLEFSKRIAVELKSYFGTNIVFFDQTTIGPGAKWPQKIRDKLNVANVVLVVIGPQWLQARDEKTGRRRIDIKDDWVREEIITALGRKRSGDQLEILPILVGNTAMPEVTDLDEELGELCHFQAIKLPNTGSHHDFDDLKDQLIRYGFQCRILPPVSTPRFGRIPHQLNAEEEEKFLAEFKQWEIVETDEPLAPGGFRRELHRVYEFPTFDLAFQFMTDVVERGIQRHNHHPRWENAFNRVEVWLTTFNLNYKLSKRDLRLAKICEVIWEEIWNEYRLNLRK